MKDEEIRKPVFFSTNLHTDLSQAFEELEGINHDMREMVQFLDESGDKCADSEASAALRENADILLGITDTLDKWIVTYRDAVCDELEDNHLVYERDAYQTLSRILTWDKADIRQLVIWIRELKRLCAKIGLTLPYLLHVRSIPTEPVPEDVSKYPVFVVDRQGYCLCGMELAEVRYIDEVRDRMGLL